jgi:hypothetical protein
MPEILTKYKKQIFLFFFSTAIGGLFFVSILGTSIIDPTNIAWLMEKGDWPQHFLGWHFFRNESWHFPLGKLNSIQPFVGASIGYTDSIPIMALMFKLFANILPHNFQYIGLWLLLCFCLQGFFGALLLSTVSRNLTVQLLSSVFFVISPILLIRTGHPALCAHWILLAGLWLYFRKWKDFSHFKSLGCWICLVITSAAVHPTINIMTLALAFAYYFRSWLVDHVMKVGPCILNFSMLILFTLFVWWVIGYFELGKIGSSYGHFGFGYFSLNLLAPFNPINWVDGDWKGSWSTFLITRPMATKGQADGFNYLGIGVIILGLWVFYALIINLPKFKTVKPILPIAVVSIFFTLFALSNKITLGSHLVYEIKLNHYLLSALSPFRSSGRFFWPVYYFIIFCIIAVIVRRNNTKIGVLILLIGISFQLIDFHNIYNISRYKELRHPPKEWNNPLNSELWNSLGEKYNKIILVPPRGCEDEPVASYIPFSYFAANHGMSTNSFYLARYNYDTFHKNCQNLFSDVRDGVIDSNSVYILNKKYLKILKSSSKVPVICATVDGFDVCVSDQGEDTNSIINTMKGISVSKAQIDTG